MGDMEAEVLEDPKLKDSMQKLLLVAEGVAGFELSNGRLMYKGRLVLLNPPNGFQRFY